MLVPTISRLEGRKSLNNKITNRSLKGGSCHGSSDPPFISKRRSALSGCIQQHKSHSVACIIYVKRNIMSPNSSTDDTEEWQDKSRHKHIPHQASSIVYYDFTFLCTYTYSISASSEHFANKKIQLVHQKKYILEPT